MITLLVIVAVAALLFGGWSYSVPDRRELYGYWGWSPLALIIFVALLMYVTGVLR